MDKYCVLKVPAASSFQDRNFSFFPEIAQFLSKAKGQDGSGSDGRATEGGRVLLGLSTLFRRTIRFFGQLSSVFTFT